MAYPEDDGLLPEFTPSSESNSRYAPPVKYSNSGVSGDEVDFSPPPPTGEDYEGNNPDIFQPLPGNLVGGLDHIRANRQRKIDKMLEQSQKSPIYQDEDGGYTKTAPDPYISGEYRPIEGAPFRVNNPSATPVQYRMAQDMQKQFNFPMLPNGMPLSDADIYQNAPKIWDQLLNASAGNMNPQNFLASPFWDNFKGLDNDTLAALKTTVGRAIKPFYNSYTKKQGVFKTIKEEMADPDSGEMFTQFFKPHEKEIISQAGTAQATHLLDAIKQKATLLSEDPDAMAAFQELGKKSQIIPKPDDDLTQAQIDDLSKSKAYFRALMVNKNATGFASILNHYIQYKQSLQDKRSKLSDSVDEIFKKASGADDAQNYIQDLVKNGYYDGRERMLSKDMDLFKSTEGPVKIGSTTVPGGKLFFDEREAVDKITGLIKNGANESDIFITPDRKVLTGKQWEEYQKQDVHLHFPNSGFKQNGKYLALPTDFFKDENDQEVFLTLPGVNNENQGASPITYKSGDTQYVLRDALDKAGIKLTKDDLSSGVVLGRSKSQFLTNEATPYEARFINASQFLNKDTPDGQRFIADGEFYKESQYRQSLRDSLSEKALIMTQSPTDPSYIGEFSKGIARGVGKTLVTGALSVSEGMAMTYDTLRAGFNRMLMTPEGDKAASDAWGRVEASYGRYKNLNSEVDEAADGGFIGLNHVLADPSATGAMHVAGVVGEIGGDIGGIAIEMYGTGGLGAPALAGKLTSIGSKILGYEQELTRLSSLAGKASEIAQIRNGMSKANMVVSESLNFMAQNLMTGHGTPTELMEGGAYGLVLGLSRVPGRGFNMGKTSAIQEMENASGVAYKEIPGAIQQPRFIDKWRALSATAGAAGTIGLDTIIKQHQGMTNAEIMEWWKNPDNLAGMVLQLAAPYFGSHVMGSKSMDRQQFGPPHAQMIPRVKLMEGAAANMAPDYTVSHPQGSDEHYTHGSTDLHEYWKMATTSELATRGRVVSDQIEAFSNSGKEIPESLIRQYEVIKQNLLGDDYRQVIHLGNAKARDLESWGIIKKMLPMLENKEPSKPITKLLGLQKTPEGPQVSEVSKMTPSQLVDHIQTVRENPTRQYSEAGKFNASIKKLVEFSQSPEMNSITDKGLIKSIKNIVQDQGMLTRAARPEWASQKLGDDIIDPKTNGHVNSKDIENALKIKEVEKLYDEAKDKRDQAAAERREKRDVKGWGELKLEKSKDGWVARAKVHGRIQKGQAEFKVPNSGELTEHEARFLANNHFEQEFYKFGDKQQEIAAHEIHGEEKNIYSELEEGDKEIAKTLLSDTLEKGGDMQAAIKKLMGEKFGFSRDEVDSIMQEFTREQGESLGESRDFISEEIKKNGCE